MNIIQLYPLLWDDVIDSDKINPIGCGASNVPQMPHLTTF